MSHARSEYSMEGVGYSRKGLNIRRRVLIIPRRVEMLHGGG